MLFKAKIKSNYILPLTCPSTLEFWSPSWQAFMTVKGIKQTFGRQHKDLSRLWASVEDEMDDLLLYYTLGWASIDLKWFDQWFFDQSLSPNPLDNCCSVVFTFDTHGFINTVGLHVHHCHFKNALFCCSLSYCPQFYE